MGPDWLGVSAITKELRQKMLVMLKADYGRSEKLQISRSERFCQAWKVVRSPNSLLWGTKYSSNRKFHLNHWWCWFLLPARVVTPWRSFVNPMKLSLPSECLTHSWNTCAGTLGASPTSCSCVFIGRNQTNVPKLIVTDTSVWATCSINVQKGHPQHSLNAATSSIDRYWQKKVSHCTPQIWFLNTSHMIFPFR